MQNVFTYGSLMFTPVWSRVVNGTYTQTPARLDGYQRLAVLDEDYPVAVPSLSHKIDGIVYLGVNNKDLGQLDEFEGEYYLRTDVKVETDNGLLEAQTYILKPQYLHIAATYAWDVEAFHAQGIHRFMALYQGFNHSHSSQ